MLFFLLARLDDWESDSHAGCISGVSEHGRFLTYATFFSSYINDTISETSDILYEADVPDTLLVAMYDDVEITFVGAQQNIIVYQNYTWENDDDIEETIWQETECIIKEVVTTQLYLYKDYVVRYSGKSAVVTKLIRAENDYNEMVVSTASEQLLTTANDTWAFINIRINDTETPFVFNVQKKDFYLSYYGDDKYHYKIAIPEMADVETFKVLPSNSSEHDDLVAFLIGNSTIQSFRISFDNTTEPAKFVCTLVSTIDIEEEILPKLGLDDIAVFYDYQLYSLYRVTFFGDSFIATYPLIPDDSVYYVLTNDEKDQFTISLIRQVDKYELQLTVDNAPYSLYTNGYQTLYMMGSEDGSQSGYFTIDTNYIFPSYIGEEVSCWTMSNRLSTMVDSGKRNVSVSLLDTESCDPSPPRVMTFCDLISCQIMTMVTKEKENETATHLFYIELEHTVSLSFDLIPVGAIGLQGGLLADQMSIGVSLLEELESCWDDLDLYDGSLSYNILLLELSTPSSNCRYETPIIIVEGQTFLKQKVQLRLITPPSPQSTAIYTYFFDPGEETFAGDVEFKISIESVSPSGQPISTPREYTYLFETDMDSCWNIPKYIGMAYSGDHFELLLANRIWSERTDPVCDSRIDEMPDLEVKFSYKVKQKKSLTLEESDFVKLENGKWAYFIEFDVYDDWVSSTVHLFTDGEVTPYVGDDFELDGDYPIEFVEPDSCFEYMELIKVEYDNDYHAYVTMDHQYWCAPSPLDSEYSVVVYALNQDPDEDGDYPYCNMTYVPSEGYYENRDCELEIGTLANFTVFEMSTYINEHDEWEEGELIAYTVVVTVVDSRYDYTYIIIVAVFGSLFILLGAGWTTYWYLRKYRVSATDDSMPFDVTSTIGTLPTVDGNEDLPAPPRPERKTRNIFGEKKKRDKAFDEELFAAIPAPPTKW